MNSKTINIALQNPSVAAGLCQIVPNCAELCRNCAESAYTYACLPPHIWGAMSKPISVRSATFDFRGMHGVTVCVGFAKSCYYFAKNVLMLCTCSYSTVVAWPVGVFCSGSCTAYPFFAAICGCLTAVAAVLLLPPSGCGGCKGAGYARAPPAPAPAAGCW